MIKLNQIIHGDCLEVMKDIDDKSIDCVITSPPYFNSAHKYQRGKGYHYNVDVGEPLYLIEDAFELIKSKLKDNAVVCLNLGFSYGETGVMRPFDVINRLRNKQGYFVNDIIIWHKNNPIPMQNRLTNAIEYIFVLSNHPISKYYNVNYTHNVWKFPIQAGDGQSATFPIELPLNCLETFTKENDVVLDCFSGSGTTAIACIQTKRNFIGIEKDKLNFNNSLERIEKHKLQFKLVTTTSTFF